MRRSILSLAALLTLFTAAPAYAAFDPFGGVNCNSDTNSSAVCTDKKKTDNPITGSNGIITKITNILAIIAGIAAVIIIVVAGIKYTTSAGDAKAAGEAKNTIISALIGLVVIALARTIIVFVVSKT